MFPLPNVVLFPKTMLALHVFEPRYRLMMDEVLKGNQSLVIALLKPGWEADYHGTPEVHPLACVGKIVQHQELADGRYNITVHGEYKVAIESVEQSHPFRVAKVRRIHEDNAWGEAPGAADQTRELMALFRRFNEGQGAAIDLAQVFGAHMAADGILNSISMHLNVEPAVKQRLLELESTEQRYRAVFQFLSDSAAVQDSIDQARHRFPADGRQN
ncbi:MAG TPA: LON peptidase substrate-binding domain-containing protein [Candidatus Eisenbacteria bacterium]|nr:LON peptidase substrate-binding domain-containing protein [Candidatus Eisenbacteria bacterium]